MKQVLIAIDQLINTIFGGYADETLSSRAYRRKDMLHIWIDKLFFWQTEHCKQSYEAEQKRLQLPPEFRNVIYDLTLKEKL